MNTNSNYYLSKDRNHLNRMQRERRANLIRIDYADVSPEADAVIDSQRNGGIDGTASAILNRIITEWAECNGITKKI